MLFSHSFVSQKSALTYIRSWPNGILIWKVWKEFTSKLIQVAGGIHVIVVVGGGPVYLLAVSWGPAFSSKGISTFQRQQLSINYPHLESL